MTLERAKQIAKQLADGHVCSLREGEMEEYNKMCRSVLRAQQEHASLCDLCAYNPLSSFDGKPCTMCPATPLPELPEEDV